MANKQVARKVAEADKIAVAHMNAVVAQQLVGTVLAARMVAAVRMMVAEH